MIKAVSNMPHDSDAKQRRPYLRGLKSSLIRALWPEKRLRLQELPQVWADLTRQRSTAPSPRPHCPQLRKTSPKLKKRKPHLVPKKTPPKISSHIEHSPEDVVPQLPSCPFPIYIPGTDDEDMDLFKEVTLPALDKPIPWSLIPTEFSESDEGDDGKIHLMEIARLKY